MAVRNSFKLRTIDIGFINAEVNRTINPNNLSVGRGIKEPKHNYVYIILMLHVSAFLESHHQATSLRVRERHFKHISVKSHSLTWLRIQIYRSRRCMNGN